jgi:hypothetical protein
MFSRDLEVDGAIILLLETDSTILRLGCELETVF